MILSRIDLCEVTTTSFFSRYTVYCHVLPVYIFEKYLTAVLYLYHKTLYFLYSLKGFAMIVLYDHIIILAGQQSETFARTEHESRERSERLSLSSEHPHRSEELCQNIWFVTLCILLFLLSLCRLCFSLLSLELGRCSSDLFLSSRPRTGLATTCIIGYG